MSTNQDSSSRCQSRTLSLEVHPQVFWISAGLIIAFATATVTGVHFWGKSTVEEMFQSLQVLIAADAGWFFILVANFFLLFVFLLLVSRFGTLRIGGKEARPDFSYPSYLAMLFSAGMGIGLLFWSVAEPVAHCHQLPWGEPHAPGQAGLAMAVTYFHWGLHAWCIYSIVALSLAFAAYNGGLPLTIRSAFYPLLGERIHGWMGNTIDILAVIATLFGVATSLGFGAKQIQTGLTYLTGLGGDPSTSLLLQILLITIITGMATTSVVMGLDGGIRRISEITVLLALVLLLFVFFMGPTLFLLDSFVQNVGAYLRNFLQLSFYTEAYSHPQRHEDSWQVRWTIFYWAWWITWSPFVGMFIARISRGYTIRTMIVSVLFIPTGITFLWLSIFGNAALYEELFGGGRISSAMDENIALALFQLLELYPLPLFSSILAIVVIVLFFVTSSDSGSLVIDIISAGGNLDPPILQRIFWAVLEGVIAAVLLLGGGLVALQTASIVMGLPFAVVILFMCISLWKGLERDRRKSIAGDKLDKAP